MAILRSLSNPVDQATAERDARLAAVVPCPEMDTTSLPFEITTRRMLRAASAFEREQAECDVIERTRPLGAEKPRVEPKSIDDILPPSRISWEPPRKRYVAPGPRKCTF